jgi:hypothetical protein
VRARGAWPDLPASQRLVGSNHLLPWGARLAPARWRHRQADAAEQSPLATETGRPRCAFGPFSCRQLEVRAPTRRHWALALPPAGCCRYVPTGAIELGDDDGDFLSATLSSSAACCPPESNSNGYCLRSAANWLRVALFLVLQTSHSVLQGCMLTWLQYVSSPCSYRLFLQCFLSPNYLSYTA